VVFWDLWGKLGHPVRTTVSEMGPTLLSRILELNETQAGVLDIVFKLADDRGLLLLDLDDLRALLGLIADERKDISTSYGLVSTPSIGAIQRALLRLEQEGADMFFGEPALELSDLMRTTTDGRGVVNILAANQLILKPKLYSSFLLWLLSELFENLPGSRRPRQAEAGVRVRRSAPAVRRRAGGAAPAHRTGRAHDPLQGRGRVLLLAVPRRRARRDPRPDRQPLPARAARLHPARPEGSEDRGRNLRRQSRARRGRPISQLGTGEALVSTLQDKGVPMPVEKTLIAPPRCRMGAITDAERAQVRAGSPVGMKYDNRIDRDSAAELLAKKAEAKVAQAEAPPAKTRDQDDAEQGGFGGAVKDAVFGTKRRQGMIETMAKQTTRTIGAKLGNQIVRGILGSIFGGKR
jgi:hypothetical protein